MASFATLAIKRRIRQFDTHVHHPTFYLAFECIHEAHLVSKGTRIREMEYSEFDVLLWVGSTRDMVELGTGRRIFCTQQYVFSKLRACRVACYHMYLMFRSKTQTHVIELFVLFNGRSGIRNNATAKMARNVFRWYNVPACLPQV